MSAYVLLGGIAVWFAAGAMLSAAARNRTSGGVVEYFLANRRMGGVVSALTYSATTFSAFMMVGLVGFTYSTGVGAIGFELTYVLATVVLLVVFGPRYWLAGRRYNLVSPGELLSVRYKNRAVGAVVAVLCLVMLIPYASVQLMGVGYLMETLSGGTVSYGAGVAIAAAIAVIYSLSAGMRSVAWTDALQSAIMMIVCVMLVIYASTEILPFSAVAADSKVFRATWSFPMFLGLTLPWAFFAVTNPQVVQRLYVPQNPGGMSKMILLFSLFGLFYTLMCGYLGVVCHFALPGLKSPDMAMPELLMRTPLYISLPVTLGITAAAVSTLNSIILTLSSQIGRDIIKALRPGTPERTELLAGKLMIPSICAACVAFAMARPGMIAVLSSMASGGLLVQLPAVAGAFFWARGSARGAIWSMAAGASVVGTMSVMGLKPLGQWPSVWGLAVSSVVYLALSMSTKGTESGGKFISHMKDDLKKSFRI